VLVVLVLGVGRHAEEDRLRQQADGGDAQQPGEGAARHVIATLRRRFGSSIPPVGRRRAVWIIAAVAAASEGRNGACRRRLKTLPVAFWGGRGGSSFLASMM